MLTKVENINADAKIINYLRRKILGWGYIPTIDYPWRTESSKFHGLIAEVLLQRTRAEQVIPIYKKFKKTFPDPFRLSSTSSSRIKKLIAPLGLSWRAEKLKNLGSVIHNDFAGVIPKDYLHLTRLPGVGHYAASAFLSFHLNKKATIIDSNIIRLYSRFFGFQTNPEIRRNKSLIKLFEIITPDRDVKDFNYALLDLSRSICKPRPLCKACPISNKCAYATKGTSS